MAMTGAMAPAKSAGHLVAAASDVARAHGWRALYRGNLANVARSAPQKALDFFAFDAFKSALAPPRGGGAAAAGRPPSAAAAQPGTAATLAAAGMAGAVSNMVLYPLEVVRTRLSTDTLGIYKGVGHAFRAIWAAEGPRAMYRCASFGLHFPSLRVCLQRGPVGRGGAACGSWRGLVSHAHNRSAEASCPP